MGILEKLFEYLPPKLILSTVFFTSLVTIFVPGVWADFERTLGALLLVTLIHVILSVVFRLIKKKDQNSNGAQDE